MLSEETSTYIRHQRETVKVKASDDGDNSVRPNSLSIRNTLSGTGVRRSFLVSKEELVSPKNEKVNWIQRNKRAALKIRNRKVKNIEDVKNERLEKIQPLEGQNGFSSKK